MSKLGVSVGLRVDFRHASEAEYFRYIDTTLCKRLDRWSRGPLTLLARLLFPGVRVNGTGVSVSVHQGGA